MSTRAFQGIVACLVASSCVARASSSSQAEAEIEQAMQGTLYEPARKSIQAHCSPCHWKNGQHPKRTAAYPTFQVDTYDQWSSVPTIVPVVLDKWNPDGVVMPPPEAWTFPPDDERRMLLDWARRGSPNTPSGT